MVTYLKCYDRWKTEKPCHSLRPSFNIKLDVTMMGNNDDHNSRRVAVIVTKRKDKNPRERKVRVLQQTNSRLRGLLVGKIILLDIKHGNINRPVKWFVFTERGVASLKEMSTTLKIFSKERDADHTGQHMTRVVSRSAMYIWWHAITTYREKVSLRESWSGTYWLPQTHVTKC